MTELTSKTLIRLVLPYEQEIDKYPILPGQNSSFYNRYYTTIQIHPLGGWFVTHSGGGYPLDMSPSQEQAVKIESTYRVMVILDKSDFIPRKVYNSLLALLSLEKRELWVVKSSPLTLDQGVIEHQLYLLCPGEQGGFSYIAFEDHQDGGGIEVHLSDTPDTLEER